MLRTTMLLSAMALAGCATMGTDKPMAIEGDSISYETGPCFGTCPVYTVTIRPDGTGTFEGKRFTAVTGTRDFTASPAAYRRFAAALAPYRPKDAETLYQPGGANCPNAPTDMPSVDVRWSEASGGARHLGYYYGCGDAAMRGAMRAAPDALPIARFIRADRAPGS